MQKWLLGFCFFFIFLSSVSSQDPFFVSLFFLGGGGRGMGTGFHNGNRGGKGNKFGNMNKNLSLVSVN